MSIFVKCPLCTWNTADADAFAAFSLLDLHESLVHPEVRTPQE